MSEQVQEMFLNIARRYDLANDILSFGIHRIWRRQAVGFGGIQKGQIIVDLCTGTGDFALCLVKEVGVKGKVIGIDFVKEMLEIAHKKEKAVWERHGTLASAASLATLEFLQADALCLPLASQSVDIVTVAFGIRNVDNPLTGLKEIRRVLKPGGRVLVLEFGQPRLPFFSQVYRAYSFTLMPLIGGLITGNVNAYKYLPQTVFMFPAGEDFLDLMKQAGFSSLQCKAFLYGVAYAYVGVA